MNRVELRNIGFDFKKYNNEFIRNLSPIEKLNLYIILPNFSMLEEYRKNLATEFGGFYLNNILTLDNIAEEFSYNKKYISRQEGSFIIKKILEKEDVNFSKSLGSSKSIQSYIYELKSNKITYDNLSNKRINNERINEISEVYREYEEFLYKNNLGDEIDLYLDASNNLNNTISDKTFLISNFIEFRENELYLIESLGKNAKDVIIEMPFSTNRSNLKLQNSLLKLEKIGFEINKEISIDKINSEFSYNSLSDIDKKYNIDHSIIKASNKYYEINEIFNIISKIRSEISFEDISIIANDSYKNLIKTISKERDISVNIGNSQKARDLFLIRDVLNFLKFIKNDEKKYIIGFISDENINRSFKDLSNDETEKLLVSLREIEYKGIYHKYKNNQDILFEYLNFIRDLLKNYNHNPVETLKNIYNLDYLEKKSYLEFENHKNHDVLSDEIKSHEIIDDIFKQVINFNKIINLSSEDITDLFIEIINNYEYYTRTNEKSIKVLNPINAVGVKSKIRFICGLDYDYPKVKMDSIIDNTSLNKFHKSLGIDLESREEKIDNIILQFQSLLSESEEYYFSYIFNDNKLIENKSFILNQTLDNLEENSKKEYIITSQLKKLDTIDKNDLKSHFIYEAFNNDEFINSNYLENNEVSYINRILENEYKRFNKNLEFIGKVDKENIEDLPNFYSPKSLGILNECPFKYYIEYILKYKKIELDFKDTFSLDKGNLFHLILEKYYKKYDKDVDDENINNVVSNLLEEIIIEQNLNLQDYQKSVIIKIISEYITLDSADQRSNNSRPLYFEKEYSKSFDSIVIAGKIDRIDDNNGKVSIVDYKSGRVPTISSVNDFRQIQLPLYAYIYGYKDIEDLKYGNITEAKMIYPLKKLEDIDGYYEDLENLIISLNKINQNGEYFVMPKDDSSCKYCDYNEICRVSEVKVETE